MTAQGSSPARPARSRRILFVLAAAVGLAAAGLAAVSLLGGESSKGVSLAEAAANVKGESMRARFDIEGTEGGESFSFVGEGTMSADSTAGVMKGTLTVAGQQPIDADIRLRGADAWMASEQFAGVMPPGKRWLHMRDPAMATQTMTPSEFVRFLEGADDVEELGEEPVAGTRATHFRGKVDVGELAEETGGATAKRLERILAGRELRMPIDVWVTADGLPKLMRISIDAGASSVRMELEALEYGVPVDVEPPPARTVVEESELGG
jgi:hypothetical protein